MNRLKGIPVSGGIVVGKAYCIGREEFSVSEQSIPYEDVSKEIYRFEEALIETRKQINSLQKKISKNLGSENAKIFEAHLLVLEDRVLIEDVLLQIKTKRINVEYAFWHSIKKYIDTLLKLNDEYLRERVVDIEDVARRVLRYLLQKEMISLDDVKEKVVIVAHDLSPSQVATLPKDKILAFVIEVGGRTSHTAIIARSLGIPAVVGVDSISSISVGSTVIVDGNKGDIVANPTKDSLRVYTGKADDFYKTRKIIYDMRNVSAKTVDGHEVFVESNIEFPEELSMVSEYGSEGVGLYRTEYLFLSQRELPSEEQQYRAYSLVAKKMAPKKVVFRTIDIGGDKFLSHTASQRENSPFLGCRAIRFSLANINLFKAQLRAILRASVYKNVKVMFPLISGIEELRKAKDILQECKEELKNEGTKYDENIKVGVMIEVPSAALTADILAKESDFFSIGTNDLIQYSLAVDRVNEKVAYLYEAAHPAVLKLIKMIIDAGHANSIPVAMCGEMSGDPLFVLLLLGLGLDEFSMPPPMVPKVKMIIRQISFELAQGIAQKAITYGTAKQVNKYLKGELKKIMNEEYYRLLGMS